MRKLNKTLPVALAGSMLLAGQAFGGDAINIVSWGGAWSASVKGAWTDLYEEETGQAFNFIDYNGGVAEIRAQNEAGNVTWDIVDMIPSDLTTACDEGLLEELETPDPDDWFDTHPCGIGVVIWATVMAHMDGTYADEKPSMVADFWDFDRFPGKRSMRKVAEVNLEWALIADGVAVGDVYEMLTTEEGADRAFAKLDAVKDQSVWWEAGAQAPQILVDGEAALGTAYNGRIYNAYKNENQPLTIMWNSQVWDIGFMGIPKGAPERRQGPGVPDRQVRDTGVPGPDHLSHRVRPDAEVGFRVQRPRGHGAPADGPHGRARPAVRLPVLGGPPGRAPGALLGLARALGSSCLS